MDTLQPYSEAEKASLCMLVSYWTRGRAVLVLSNLQWIGDHYRPAAQATWRWWSGLESWVTENAARIGRFIDKDDDTGKEVKWSFWAFPSALQKLKRGVEYDACGWKLGQEIQAATGPHDIPS